MRLLTVFFLMLSMTGQATLAQQLTNIQPDGQVHIFAAHDGAFFIDGEETLIVSGEMHFGRVLPEDWETRLKQAKAMGLNTVSFYLFWNLCEPREGTFDFTGMTDVRRMIQLCQEHGLWVILRPGPYSCAEVEYGGIPWWTAKYPDVPIRSTHPQWLAWSRRYIEQVFEQVGDLQVTRGGPLLMLQMDNEHGMISGGNDSYMVALHKIFRNAGFDIQLFTCDPGAGRGNEELADVLRGHNGYKGARAQRWPSQRAGAEESPPPRFPIFVPELYTNWFTGWGMNIASRYRSVEEVVRWTETLIDEKVSFNYYMLYGGTTFGYFNGCNEYLPVHTSYDYSAPIDEAGRVTEKYRQLRQLISEKLELSPPEPPADPPVIEIASIHLDQAQPLIHRLPAKPTQSALSPVTMEALDQAYGFVLYRKPFENGLKGTLTLKDPMDYAIVMVDGKTIGRVYRGYGQESFTMELPEKQGSATLDILVYNLGRISVITAPWTQNRARKGLIGGATLDGTEISGWDMYSLPLDSVMQIEPSPTEHIGPTFYQGTFTLDKLGGTFLDMRGWGMGVVWVNGHNLGRHWDRGALRSLFVPRHWLRKGENKIVVLELHDAPESTTIRGGTQIVTEDAHPFDIRLDQPASFWPRGKENPEYPGFTIRRWPGWN